MKITIHRGTHRIGGCVTEICTRQSRVFIDFGTELPEPDGQQVEEKLSIAGLTEAPANCGGVFFTHYHGDHVGNVHRILPEIPIYMGAAAKTISMLLAERLQKAYIFHPDHFRDQSSTIRALGRMQTYRDGEAICVGDIKITPYRVDHSAFDAYLFLIEAEGRRVLHTGDFRNHGYTGKDLSAVLGKIGKVDVLLCEGTMLSRSGEPVLTEKRLEEKAKDLLVENKNVFVLCSSTNIDRIRAFYQAKPQNKPGVCDFYQKQVLDAVEEFDRTLEKGYQFEWVIPDAHWNQKLHHWMDREGFLMFVRVNDRFKAVMEPYRDNCKVVYSMWSGYLKNPSIRDFLAGYDWEILHTSGHATVAAIEMMIAALKPEKIIPLHTEIPDMFEVLFPEQHVMIAQDGCAIDV